MTPAAEIIWRRWHVNEYAVLVEWCRQQAALTPTAGSPSTGCKNCPSAKTHIDNCRNLGLRGEIPANNRLSDSTTLDAKQSGTDSCPCFGETRCHRFQDRQRYATMVFWVTRVYSCRLTPTPFTTSRLHLHNWRTVSSLTLQLYGSDLRAKIVNKVVKRKVGKRDSPEGTKRNWEKWKSHNNTVSTHTKENAVSKHKHNTNNIQGETL